METKKDYINDFTNELRETINKIEEEKKKKYSNLLNIRLNITYRFLALSSVLSMIFYYFWLEKLSKYFALVCFGLFLIITFYFFVVMWKLRKIIKKNERND